MKVTPFDLNSQRDVAVILQVVLDELKGVSLARSSLISNAVRTTASFNTCLCSSVSEENLDILRLALRSSGNKWFCPSCNTLSKSTRETCVMNSALILAIQLCRFSNRGSQVVKDETLVSCTQSQYLAIPVTIEDEVSFINKYSLIVTINHSGTLSKGHSWACIKDLHSPCWYKLVSNVEESYLNNITSYILFYSKV